MAAAQRRPQDPDLVGQEAILPDSPTLPDAPPPDVELLAECLSRLQDAGLPGLCVVLREHPAEARRLLRRLRLLAALGLLPDPPGPA